MPQAVAGRLQHSPGDLGHAGVERQPVDLSPQAGLPPGRSLTVVIGQHHKAAHARLHAPRQSQQLLDGPARRARPPLQQLPVPVGGAAHHLHPGHRAEVPGQLGGTQRRFHRHAQPPGATAGVMATAGSAETTRPEAHVGVVGPAHQRRAGRQVQRPVAMADDRPHLNPLAVSRNGLLAGPQSLDVARAQAAQRPVPDLRAGQRAARLVTEKLELGQVLPGPVQADARRMTAGRGPPDRVGALVIPQRDGGGALAADAHGCDLQAGLVHPGQEPVQAVEPGRGISSTRRPRSGPLEGLVHPEPHTPAASQCHRAGSAGPEVDANNDRAHRGGSSVPLRVRLTPPSPDRRAATPPASWRRRPRPGGSERSPDGRGRQPARRTPAALRPLASPPAPG